MRVIDLKSQRGSILIMFLFMVVFLSIFWTIAGTLIVAEVRSQMLYTEDKKVFYAAESGLEIAIGELNNGGNGTFSNVDIGGVTVNCTNTGDSILTVVASTNVTAKSLQIKIQKISQNFPAAFYYVASSFEPSKLLKFKGPHAKYIDGEIWSYTTQEVYFENDVGIGDVTVHVPEGTEVDNQTGTTISVEYFTPGTTPLEWPVLNTQYYDNYINNINGYFERDDEIGDDLDLTTLPDGVYYVDDDLEIEDGCTITGPGVIVATKKIKISDDVTIGPNVKIIAAKELKFEDSSVLTGMNSILYSSEKVKVEGDYTFVSGSIISPENVEIDGDHDLAKRGTITGIVYSGDRAKIRHTIINGSVVADYYNGNEIHCTYLTFNESYLPTTCPPGFTQTSSDTVLIVDGSWNVVY